MIVGFDFGTHSTKILYRKRHEETARVLVIDEAVPGYPAFASPALVRLDRGLLWFGSAAHKRTEGVLYRSLKVRLLGPGDEPDENYPLGPAPDLLIATYLTWAFQRVRAELDKLFDADVRLNLSVPMDQFEEPRRKLRMLQIVQAAWTIANDSSEAAVQQGVELRLVQDRLRALMDGKVADEGDRKFDVHPETVAPIVSLSMDPRTAPGMYLIVDIGAGTTEVSINHSVESGVNHRVVCYFDESAPIGGDQFSALNRFAADKRQLQCELLANRIVEICARVWACGYRKDAPNHLTRTRWRKLTILLSGGGARHPAIRSAFEGSPRLLSHLKLCDVRCEVRTHSPVNVVLEPPLCTLQDLALLVVAKGLTREREKWPKVFNPPEVEPLQATERADQAVPQW